MQIQTLLFGTITIDPEKIITFPDGIPAFEQCKRFYLVHEAVGAGDPVSYTLQSVDDPQVAFQIMDPTAVGFQYELEVSDEEMAKLQLSRPEEAAVMIMLYKQQDIQRRIGANVRAPLLLNLNARLGLQKVISRYRSNVVLSNLSTAV